MTNQQAAPSLAQARAAIEALRSGYLTSTERALADLALALAQELDAARRDALVAGSVLASAAAVTGATTALPALGGAAPEGTREEIEGLRAQVAAQRSAMQQLNRDLDAIYRRNGLARGQRSEPPMVEAPPRRHHTLDEFAANLPDFGDDPGQSPSLGQSQALAHLSQPRVRPQDIQLSAADYARQNQRRQPRLTAHYAQSEIAPAQAAGSGLVFLALFFGVALLIMAFVLFA